MSVLFPIVLIAADIFRIFFDPPHLIRREGQKMYFFGMPQVGLLLPKIIRKIYKTLNNLSALRPFFFFLQMDLGDYDSTFSAGALLFVCAVSYGGQPRYEVVGLVNIGHA
jgi:hypothetical protein